MRGEGGVCVQIIANLPKPSLILFLSGSGNVYLGKLRECDTLGYKSGCHACTPELPDSRDADR